MLLILLVCTAELFWKFSWLFCGDSTYFSYYCYLQLSYSDSVFTYSMEAVEIANITTKYSWLFWKRA